MPEQRVCLWSVKTGELAAWIGFTDDDGPTLSLPDGALFRYHHREKSTGEELARIHTTFNQLFKPSPR